ncbi:MAG: hypothetical protein HYT80_11335 [Euryarchaeota archaeon]|nr:hypothetical protein [Euryarchaeota archaeon]
MANKKVVMAWATVGTLLAVAVVGSLVGAAPPARRPGIVWLNHFDLLPGSADVTTSYDATSAAVVGGLTALVIQSTTLGDWGSSGGIKVVHMGVSAPPNTIVKGVRLCYELSSSAAFVTQIRLAQVQDPPQFALVMLDDGTDLTAPGPVCVDSAETTVDAAAGALLLDLRVNFDDTSEAIAIRGVGLNLLTQ